MLFEPLLAAAGLGVAVPLSMRLGSLIFPLFLLASSGRLKLKIEESQIHIVV